jgi:Na+/phosphate symporter
VGVLGTVLIQSSTTTTAIAVTAVGAGALPIRGAIPVLRPVPLWCAQTIARIAVDRKWVVAAYLITGFIVLPALVILLVGVL